MSKLHTIPAAAIEFWSELPGQARVVVNLPVTVTSDDHLSNMGGMLTPAQQYAINALDTLVGSGNSYGRKYDITVSIPARGLLPMPVGVFTLEWMNEDKDSGDVIPSGNVVYLHPDGSLRTWYRHGAL